MGPDPLKDRLLFTPERDALRPFLSRVRLCVGIGHLPWGDVAPLAALFRRYGVK